MSAVNTGGFFLQGPLPKVDEIAFNGAVEPHETRVIYERVWSVGARETDDHEFC